jgi:tRNA pseudouridine38-40 synthase
VQRRTYRVEVAYSGAAFAGFQQQEGERTVESALLASLRPLVLDLPKLAVGGRTDRGVSATGQVISFWSRAPLELEAIASRIDRAAPGELCALDVREVPRSFHAQFSARSRHYTYLAALDRCLEVARIDRMLRALVGRRSFTAFARDTPPGRSTVRTLLHAGARIESDRLRFDFVADGFLRRQVRVMVATCLREAAQGAADDALLVLAEQGDRKRTAPEAPASGLTLARVGYDPDVRAGR